MQSELKLALVFAALFVCCLPESSHAEEVQLFNMLDNSGFEEEAPASPDRSGLVRIPWWNSSGGASMLRGKAGERRLLTEGGGFARQPVAAFAPLAEQLVVRGRLRGSGSLTLIDGSGERATIALESPEGEFLAFEIPAARFAEKLGTPLVPRFELELRSEKTAEWDDLEFLVALPLPTPAELRAEVVLELDWILSLWLDHGLDDLGPSKSSLACKQLDVATGELLAVEPAGLHPFSTVLLNAAVLEDNASWRAALDVHLDDLLEYAVHPVTSLPRRWDFERDVALDESIELHGMFEFLIEVAFRGPANYRSRALEAVTLIGEEVLAKGVSPDGTVAAVYHPETGLPGPVLEPLQRLDVPAQLARLGVLTDDHHFSRAGREACVALAFTNYWPGSWDAIDPGWNENYGRLGRCATDMWLVFPEDKIFRGLSYGGALHYHDLWRDTLRLGGAVQANQVGCWLTLADIAQLAPETAGDIGQLLLQAARVHFKGEQYGNGTWGNLAISQFDPVISGEEAALPGTPSELLRGLAGIYRDELGLRTDEVRAMFTAVLRSSREQYRREFGYLSTRSEVVGQNMGGAELRFATGLCAMLKRLSN